VEVTLSAPCLLSEEHETAGFASGEASLDDWLVRRALPNQRAGASRTFVVSQGRRVVAYYALAAGAIACASAVGRVRRNMPDPVPMAILARLAVDRSMQGKGLGRLLFRDAALRVMSAAESIGVRGLLTHAISPDAAAFYRALGLEATPSEPQTFMITLPDLRAAL
jgi:GNAT superfamily N-acetyltransferase